MADDITYTSRVLSGSSVILPDGGEDHYSDVRIALLANGALKVYRDRSFSDAAPFENVYAHGQWVKYSSSGGSRGR